MSTPYSLAGNSIACSHSVFGFVGILSHFMIEYSLLLMTSSAFGDELSVGHVIVLLMSLVDLITVDYLISLFPKCSVLYSSLVSSETPSE